jgi:glycosyltransferase involved in cell wall biosynthesis
MKPVKILFYNHTGKISGGERVLSMIVSRLDRRRFDTLVMCPDDGPLASVMRAEGLRTVRVDALRARFTWQPILFFRYLASFLRLMRTARRVAISEKPDLIHANSVRSGLVMTSATVGLNIPIVWHVHDLLPRHPLSTAIRCVALAFRQTHIVAVSDAVARRFRGSLLRSPRLTRIHNAVELEELYPDVLQRVATRRSLGFGDGEFVLGIVGQLTPRKGQLETIQAFAQIAQELSQARLVIVGEALFNRDFEYAESLRDAAERLGISNRVLFLGQRGDIPELTRAFDLAIVNSKAEPFGLTVVEAMASGTPVLATAVDGIREIIEHARTGWLISSADCHVLAENIALLLADQDLRAKLSMSALNAVRSRFAAPAFINNIETLYRSVCISSASRQIHPEKLEVNLSAD